MHRSHVLQALARYWPLGDGPVRALPIAQAADPRPPALPPRMCLVPLPEWGRDAGVDGALLVPEACLVPGDGLPWQQVDWLAAAAWYLDGLPEREHERVHGPIHSYSVRLHGWDERIWAHAWVNRMALFLRAWVGAQGQGQGADALGPVPKARFHLTHDVDALAKTVAIRGKQGAFGLFNAWRGVRTGDASGIRAGLASSWRFATSTSDYDCLPEVLRLEGERGLSATYHLYAGCAQGLRSWLLDPSYDVRRAVTGASLRALRASEHRIGLHPSFDAWRDAESIRSERLRLEASLDRPVHACRQHWLRFSWADTWRAQVGAGLHQDATLGFNDRPGFRNGAALAWNPTLGETGVDDGFRALPLLFMDSHFYDYLRLDDERRRASMRHWLDEVRLVGGEASVLWHPHTLASDYGWRAGFVELLDYLMEHA